MVFHAVLSWLFVCLDLDDTRNLEWEVPAIPILCTHMLKGSENMRKKQAISFPTAFSLIMGWFSNWLFSTESFSSKNDDLFCLFRLQFVVFHNFLNKYLFWKRKNWNSDTFAETFIELGLHCLRCISEVSSEKRLLNISNPLRRKEKRLKNNKLRGL